MKRFEFIVTKEADRSRPKNGNNGNYDQIAIYFNGKFVTVNYISDYTMNNNRFVRVDDQTTYEIVDNRLIFTEFGESKDITELVENGQYMPFVQGFKHLVPEYQSLYSKDKETIK